MALAIGRRGQVFLKKEGTYGTEEALTASEAMRHINVGFDYNRFNRITAGQNIAARLAGFFQAIQNLVAVCQRDHGTLLGVFVQRVTNLQSFDTRHELIAEFFIDR